MEPSVCFDLCAKEQRSVHVRLRFLLLRLLAWALANMGSVCYEGMRNRGGEESSAQPAGTQHDRQDEHLLKDWHPRS